MIKCDLADITIRTEEGVAEITVPAYTVETDELEERIESLSKEYFEKSNGVRMSLADFAFYLLAQASQDPREMEE